MNNRTTPEARLDRLSLMARATAAPIAASMVSRLPTGIPSLSMIMMTAINQIKIFTTRLTYLMATSSISILLRLSMAAIGPSVSLVTMRGQHKNDHGGQQAWEKRDDFDPQGFECGDKLFHVSSSFSIKNSYRDGKEYRIFPWIAMPDQDFSHPGRWTGYIILEPMSHTKKKSREEEASMIKNTVHASAWTSLTPAPAQYRWLDEDTACEVAVVGGGIAAAMIAMRFAEAGIDTVLLSDSPLGYGSTAVSSGIMTLSGEETLTCLAEKIGPERAMTAAHLLAEALDNVENLCGSFQNGCGFRRMDSCGTRRNPRVPPSFAVNIPSVCTTAWMWSCSTPIPRASSLRFR